jgi:UDP-GlcNAc:undecaprenyl-phosphate GlcNAc-1-phosphate transferase
MNEHLLSAGLAAGIAALITNFLGPLVSEIAIVLRAVDRPGGRKVHDGNVGRLGGIAIVCGIVFGTGSIALMKWGEWGEPLSRQRLVALLLGAGMIFLVGLTDDVTGVSVLQKLAVQVTSAGLLVGMGWRFEVLGLPGGGEIELGVMSSLLTVLWIVGVTNAINLIDGLDGLAGGVVAIIAASFLIYALMQRDPFSVVLMAGILGACLGFLPHNWEPARIFMGDAGSLTLGFLLAATSVQTALKAPAAVAILVPVLALGVPIIDTGLVMVVRFLGRRKGRLFRRFLRMFHADRNHLHHLLEEVVTQRRIVVHWIYAMVFASSAMALVVALTKRHSVGFLLVAVEIAAVALVRQLGLARRARQISLRKLKRLQKKQGDAKSGDDKNSRELG